MQKNKSILFISALDFKEKSIQVIRKTPEAYVKAGWEVHYLLLRDTSNQGYYFYETPFNPNGVFVYRFVFPLSNLKNKINSKILFRFIRVISNYLAIIKLFYEGRKILKDKSFDVIYGYESHAFFSVKLLQKFGYSGKAKVVARFMGTFLFKYLTEKNWEKLILNWEMFLPLKWSSNLCIMTDDGTEGDKALKKIKSKHLVNYRFWINGVDGLTASDEEKIIWKAILNPESKKVVLSISRLVGWKKVERGLQIVAKYVELTKDKDIIYYILGDGDKKAELEQLAKMLNIADNVVFTGAIPNAEVKKYLHIADIFISTYDGSNVGNPLLEAIRTNNIIFTLNNGDTSIWIKHSQNGFIYNEDSNYINLAAKDLYLLFNNKMLQAELKKNIKQTEHEKLWTWEERMNTEISEVTKLL